MFAISVIICTYNRGDVLRETFDSYAAQRGALDADVELLVVDNNSTDNTRDITESFAAGRGNVRYVFEKTPGLSYARNTGIREARGEIVAYVDDDVFFDPDWLGEVRDVFRRHSDADCMGGKSIPVFDGGRPGWITDDLLGVYGSTMSGDAEKIMIYDEHPFGLNMAFRRGALDRVGLFNQDLGRKKKNLLSMEESDYFFRVSQAGLKVYYAPSALLYHRIPKTRINKDWVRSRYYWQGISEIVFRQIHQPLRKLQLLTEFARILARSLRRMTGGNRHPKRMYWHYKSLSFSAELALKNDMGRLRQLLAEVVSL